MKTLHSSFRISRSEAKPTYRSSKQRLRSLEEEWLELQKFEERRTKKSLQFMPETLKWFGIFGLSAMVIIAMMSIFVDMLR
ncbi:hypothetical protein ABNB59_09805 [Paenibacillus larvae]|uniref:Uncharacterized protein n=4 Tax=Paenibacillus larvae TaxID=1464 RepID=V9WBD0_9BACL|nr:hypothetical protein [Paenibacillus larvae]AHD07184.1 hypothetical protein ERIC2_c34530 [Paenibacillus larvae subsp. larvae DSM 25430]AQR78164.1 hypothetical protein BXP28_13340 [Paenibacillus larvae subsp. larvae]AQT85817.1 hypothetical protein B1222_17580 [Paenibacillus larvae subsp. pulvifaciens]AQZ45957.1 hypothetical protein B5S25_04395 [Paenibacillus larvae subsp. pulvifaciens]ARF69125.1 hypothetical protein B7C51_16880 [Paenibacillus larvae subsp. pulvifaciens]